ncbi:MAG: cell division topological specificity factor MinE [Legionellales bacterium]|nr:cell division topological specificity factor MinE [Legionellales bacterium]
MSWLQYIRRRKTSASVAKERLQIIISHERGNRSANASPDYLPMLQQDLIQVISKYVNIDPEAVKISLDKSGDFSVLELNVALPEKKPEILEEESMVN